MTRFRESSQQESISERMYGVVVSHMIPRETKNLLRLLRALVVAWILMSGLILWQAVKAQTPGEAPSKPRVSTTGRISAESESPQLASEKSEAVNIM